MKANIIGYFMVLGIVLFWILTFLVVFLGIGCK